MKKESVVTSKEALRAAWDILVQNYETYASPLDEAWKQAMEQAWMQVVNRPVTKAKLIPQRAERKLKEKPELWVAIVNEVHAQIGRGDRPSIKACIEDLRKTNQQTFGRINGDLPSYFARKYLHLIDPSVDFGMRVECYICPWESDYEAFMASDTMYPDVFRAQHSD